MMERRSRAQSKKENKEGTGLAKEPIETNQKNGIKRYEERGAIEEKESCPGKIRGKPASN